MLVRKEWFKEWFDSPYYHMLYSNRDNREAHYFIDNLCKLLELKPETDTIIDLACGKGRHSIYLNSIGFDVTGIDLSEHSIADAKKHSNARLRFEVQDLRTLAAVDQFSIALNLFTSFGYFQSIEEDVQVIKNINNVLLPEGKCIIDFMNTAKAIQNLTAYESRSMNGIRFTISKWTEHNFICKKIAVDDDDTTIEFTEKVQALYPEDLKEMLEQNNFRILHTFGDYSLNPFKESHSERLILIAQKID
jgi:SAM-dependent methyltransferase